MRRMHQLGPWRPLLFLLSNPLMSMPMLRTETERTFECTSHPPLLYWAATLLTAGPIKRTAVMELRSEVRFALVRSIGNPIPLHIQLVRSRVNSQGDSDWFLQVCWDPGVPARVNFFMSEVLRNGINTRSDLKDFFLTC